MEKAKQFALTYQSKFHFLLFGGAAIAAFNTLARPDYNLILYLYLFYIWRYMDSSKEAQAGEKINSFFIMTYSLLIDFIWTLFWGSKWSSLKTDYEGSIHTLVIVLSWIGIVLKIVVLLFIALLEWGNIKSSLPSKLQEKLNAGNYKEQKDEQIA